jgi:Lipocalin-like domain
MVGAEQQPPRGNEMKALRYGPWVVLLAIACLVHVQSAKPQEAGHVSDRARLIGAWHLEHIDSPESGGKPSDNPQPKGMLIYTRDGHMSVQLMYPKSPTNQSNQYVLDGYEASFGSYELVGKDLPRVYQFTADGKLIIRSARLDERWSVTWEHH